MLLPGSETASRKPSIEKKEGTFQIPTTLFQKNNDNQDK
jgi:hypothetical protein